MSCVEEDSKLMLNDPLFGFGYNVKLVRPKSPVASVVEVEQNSKVKLFMTPLLDGLKSTATILQLPSPWLGAVPRNSLNELTGLYAAVVVSALQLKLAPWSSN